VITLPPWLATLYADLETAIAAARLPHALLIHGAGGWGETTLAAAVAMRLIERPNDVALATTIAHPDLRWIVPEGAGEQIKIEAVRDVAEFIARTPQIAPRKVAVVTSADAMNPYATNALLKTLEEPPPDSYLILVSDGLRDLLPTLRSRCRLIAVRPVEADAAKAWVHRVRPDVPPTQLDALVFEYGGAPERVLAAIDREERPLDEGLTAIASHRVDALALAEAWSKDASVELIDRWMRYLVRVIEHRKVGRSAADPLAQALASATDRQLLEQWDALGHDRQLMRSTTNPNVRLLLETRLLAWRDLTPNA
jgi:DNA polymerase III subunit delta'